MRRVRPVLALFLCLSVLVPAWAEDQDDVRRFKRAQLLRVAERSVDPSNTSVGGIDEIRRATQAQRAEFGASERKAFAQLDTLIGTTPDSPGGAVEGVIRQAARYYRWVVGQSLPDAGPADRPGFQLLPPAGDPIRLAATPPVDAEGQVVLTPELEAALLVGEIRINLARGTGMAGDVIDLKGIRRLWDATALTPGVGQWRYTLATPEELEWAEGADYIAWRTEQSRVRAKAMAAEKAQGLVSDTEVAERKERLARMRALLTEHTRRRALLVAAFASMTAAEKHWRTEVGRLGFAIEEATGKCEDCSPEDEARLKQQLAGMQLRERAIQQEQRLLYITALRASKRLGYLDDAMALSKKEVAAAVTALTSFVNAQSEARRETQLAQLAVQGEDTAVDLQAARTSREAAKDPDVIKGWTAYIETLGPMQDLNQALISVVRLRQRLEQMSAGTAETDGDAVPDDEQDPLHSIRTPVGSGLNPQYLDTVRAKLSEPTFDAALVGTHYAAAADQILSLQRALTETRDLDPRARVFEQRAAAVEERIPARAQVYWQQEARASLTRMRAAYDDTVSAIHDQGAWIRDELKRLRRWTAELETLGVRSFAIRTDRTLGSAQLGEAADDVLASAKSAARWLSFDGETHVGTYVKRHWIALLSLLAVAVLGLLLVRYGRRWIDARLVAMARRVPALGGEPITIGAETQEARELLREAEAARREAEAAALKDAAGDSDTARGAVSGGAGEAGDSG